MSSVYFLIMYDSADPARDFGLVKIGFTDGDVADRIAQLQTGNPYELRCLGEIDTPRALDVEHFVHRTHAAQMHQLEWLRWPRDSIGALIDETAIEARRIEKRKAREDEVVLRPSNDRKRRPTPEEIALHREVQELKRKLVPEKLRLQIAERRLHAATGITQGIPGIVRVTRVEAITRFSVERAEATFPVLAERCRVERIDGRFSWQKTPKNWHFVKENQAAERAADAAKASVKSVLSSNVDLDGWSPRTTEMELLHDEFLRATQLVTRFEAHLAEFQSELTVRLNEDATLIGVCSYARSLERKIDPDLFCNTYPDEAALCAQPIAAQLRKHVYPTRSYWSENLASPREPALKRET